jgi:hypothetical protein
MHINEIGNSVDHTLNAQNSGYTHIREKYVNNSRTIKQEMTWYINSENAMFVK